MEVELSELNTLRRRLAAAQTALDDLISTGQEYTVVGSHSVKNPSIKELETRISTIKRQILARSGYALRRTAPDFR
jgi:capsule polysaccharide export protein KpsE/RkpR